LQNAPKYAGVFDKIWRWSEWPDRWGIDNGIDLVARTKDGKLWAIQAKAVSPDRSIPKSELDSFLSESNRPQFDYRLIIATTDDIGRNARDTIKGQEKPVGLVLRGDLLGAQLRWPTRIGERPPPLPRRKPRPHQSVAIGDVLRGFRRHERGQLIMACGTGKTLTALWIAEKLNSRRTLVLVPSLSLITQTLAEWGRTSRRPFDYLVVCSDETVVHRGEDPAVTSTSELGVPVTTDVKTCLLYRMSRFFHGSTRIEREPVTGQHVSPAPSWMLLMKNGLLSTMHSPREVEVFRVARR
jgi:predicted helicase